MATDRHTYLSTFLSVYTVFSLLAGQQQQLSFWQLGD
jgi:hypothetical protein